MIIAIDGPSGAGKSTVAKAVAKRLGFSCLDTGAMYRAVAWRALADGVALDDAEGLGRIARACEVSFVHEPGDPMPKGVAIDGADVSAAIRTAEIDRAVSPVSAVPAVREALVAQQRRIGRSGDYVVEGRDIGTAVFPIDSSRAASPLKPAEDAVRLDSTGRYIEDVIDDICALARQALARPGAARTGDADGRERAGEGVR